MAIWFGNPGIEDAVASQVGSIAIQNLGLGVECIAPDDPADVGPPPAFARGMRVAFPITELMMHTVGGYPEDRTTLQRQRAADGHPVL